MKKTSKTILTTVLLGTVGLNLAIDVNGRINLGTTKVGAQSTTEEEVKWKEQTVSCIDEDDEPYETIVGCFLGENSTCNPQSCGPLPTKTESDPDPGEEDCDSKPCGNKVR